jgi:Excreted virulence factor EspC, type VII ESX diderm
VEVNALPIAVDTGAVGAAASPMSGASQRVGAAQVAAATAGLTASSGAGDASVAGAAAALAQALSRQLELAAYATDRIAARLTTAADHYQATDDRIARAE